MKFKINDIVISSTETIYKVVSYSPDNEAYIFKFLDLSHSDWKARAVWADIYCIVIGHKELSRLERIIYRINYGD